ncbi:MAG: RluA family pseudouridine synthase [Anaerovoracaceae bacterium]|nr:RluA family pseudouridine synthase [Anaerovoracaceae bacterium]
MTRFYHKVTTEDENMELREIIRKHFDFSARLRNRIKREKLVMVNGISTPGWKKPAVGDEISITLPDETSGFEPQDIPLDIVYEDDDLMIINKQPGLIVHPTKGHPSGTVANALMHYMEQAGNPFKIRFVNRLDMDTSGLLIVAKNSYCQNDFTKQMRENTIEKRYIAIVKGIIDSDEGTVELPIGRPDPDNVRRGVMEGGAPSVTHYKVIDRYREHTMVELLLETGRTHQIRVHMSHIGHPVLGDWLYDGTNTPFIDRQALHAAYLTFTHPMTKERCTFSAPLPEDINKAAAMLSR